MTCNSFQRWKTKSWTIYICFICAITVSHRFVFEIYEMHFSAIIVFAEYLVISMKICLSSVGSPLMCSLHNMGIEVKTKVYKFVDTSAKLGRCPLYRLRKQIMHLHHLKRLKHKPVNVQSCLWECLKSFPST